MAIIKTVKGHKTKAESNRILKSARNQYSQFGEDGVLEAVFNTIGTNNKWCVEFGAWDGVYLSNTCNLIRNHGWHGVLIEGDEARAEKIRENHPDTDKVFTVCTWVGFEKGVNTIDKILSGTPIPKDFDLISIDVDSVDWYVWESIVEYRPRVAIVEFNGNVPNEIIFIQDRDMSINEGCSLAALVELGKMKGYELVSVVGPNGVFVIREEFSKFGIADNSVDAMHRGVDQYLWCCYNGKIYNTLGPLRWHGRNIPLPPDGLQLVSQFMHGGRIQGRPGGPGPTGRGIDLASAEGILRELFFLRESRQKLHPEEFAERHKRAWSAAKTFALQHRNWIDAPSEATS